MLECFSPEGESTVDILEYPLIDGVDSWLLGARFEATLPEPIALEWDPSTSGTKKCMYDATIPLMTKELLLALRASGVDNLDTYSVCIHDTKSGAVDDGYVAVNVLGVVAAANLSESVFRDPSGFSRADLDFDKLVLSPARARGLLLFRLAECVTGLVIHASIRAALEAKGEFGLSFVPPDVWIG